MTEISSEGTKQIPKRERLLYHGSTKPGAANLLTEHGLLADKLTLTPVLELTMDYARHGILSCWYPKRGEYSGAGAAASQPTTPINEEMRAHIRAQIEQSDIDDEMKQAYLEIVDRSQTILPNTRLGAIIIPGSTMEWAKISPYDQSRMEDYLKKYVASRDELINQREELLKTAKKIDFIDPNLTIRHLAEDMVRTDVEHYLLDIGQKLKLVKDSRDGLSGTERYEFERYLEELQSIQFEEPEYEKYRKMLASSLSKQVQDTAVSL